MENKKHELSQMIMTLRQSRDEVERQNKKLNFLASYDQLTKCLNRREFFKRFEAAWSDESTPTLSVAMLDIDHFKSVNDNHGHGKGDEVLRSIGQLLRDSVGDQGIVARMGGEEFVVMMPGVAIGHASQKAEEIRQAICVEKIGGLQITASIGISSRELMSMDTQHLLDQADQALYTAKNYGRNRVVRYDKREEVEALEAATPAQTREEPLPAPIDVVSETILEQVDELKKLSTDHSSALDHEPEVDHKPKLRCTGR